MMRDTFNVCKERQKEGVGSEKLEKITDIFT